MALLAAFCSQNAWSVSISSILLSTTFFTQSGSVGNCNFRIVLSLTVQKYFFVSLKPKDQSTKLLITVKKNLCVLSFSAPKVYFFFELVVRNILVDRLLVCLLYFSH